MSLILMRSVGIVILSSSAGCRYQVVPGVPTHVATSTREAIPSLAAGMTYGRYTAHPPCLPRHRDHRTPGGYPAAVSSRQPYCMTSPPSEPIACVMTMLHLHRKQEACHLYRSLCVETYAENGMLEKRHRDGSTALETTACRRQSVQIPGKELPLSHWWIGVWVVLSSISVLNATTRRTDRMPPFPRARLC